jgi:hypothetical protein
MRSPAKRKGKKFLAHWKPRKHVIRRTKERAGLQK